MEYTWRVLVSTIYMMSALVLVKTDSVHTIVDVSHSCPQSQADVASVRVLSDRPVSAVAYCRYGLAYSFPQVDSATYQLNVSFSPHIDAQCQFQKKQLIDTYTLYIEVFQHEAKILRRPLQRLITCAFGDNGQNQSLINNILESQLPLTEEQQNQGVDANVTIAMQVWDSRNVPLSSSREFPIGKKIRIVANMNAQPQAPGFQTISCDAVATVTRGQDIETISYSILRGGCGDGNIISKVEGFNTHTRYSVSPFFKAFRLRGSFDVRFICNFTTCSQHCDGNSCVNKDWHLLTRRNTGNNHLHNESFITGATDYFTLSDELVQGRQPSQEVPPIMLTYSSNSVSIYNPASATGPVLVGGMFSVLVLASLVVVIILNVYIVSVLYRHRFRRLHQEFSEHACPRDCKP